VRVSVNHTTDQPDESARTLGRQEHKYFLVYTYLDYFIFFPLYFTNSAVVRKDLIIAPAKDYIHIILYLKGKKIIIHVDILFHT